jgi:rhodanese-related sulfurtransferase
MHREYFLPAIALLALGVAVASLHADDKPTTRPRVQKIDVDEFDKMRQEKEAVILDVRTPDEFGKGHVPGAVNMNVNDPTFDKKVSELDKSKTYLVHCARGVRSARASSKLAAVGFEHLYDFSGGFEGWKKAGKPVQK